MSEPIESALSLKRFDSFQHRDFHNGAIIDDIREVIKDRDWLRQENERLRKKNKEFEEVTKKVLEAVLKQASKKALAEERKDV